MLGDQKSKTLLFSKGLPLGKTPKTGLGKSRGYIKIRFVMDSVLTHLQLAKRTVYKMVGNINLIFDISASVNCFSD